MRSCRLFAFSLAFTGMAFSAQAQYTSKSTTTAKPAAQPVSSYTAKPAAAGANPYTGSGKPAAPTPVAGRARPAQAPAQPAFRPRPQAEATTPDAADDELPSFDALERKTSPETAQQADNQPPAPPPPPPKGEIWIYVADFSYRDLTGLAMICRWKVVLQNKTNADIKKLVFNYSLSGSELPVRISNIDAGKSSVTKQALRSEKCPAMANVKPKIKVVSCEMGSVSDQDCMKYIVIK